jgi:branched-chain amino acid transport system ATP-binding protein
MTVAPRTIHGVIGPNGAGKSTVFNLLTGVLPLSSGEIVFKGERVSGLRPAEICRRGIARTFQATTLFRESTVLENVLIACHLHAATAFVPTLLGTAAYRGKERSVRVRAQALLASLRLSEVADQRAATLAHRDQKALCLAMVLATAAELVILDEPLAGLTAQRRAKTPWRCSAPFAPTARPSSSSSTTCAR